MNNTEDRFRMRITVGAVVEREGKILCVRERKKFEDDPDELLITPGGHLEPEETIIEGMIREVREETGYTVAPIDLIGVYMNSYQTGGPSIKFSFRAKITSDETVPIEDENIIQAVWTTPEELHAAKDRWRAGSTTQTLIDYFADTHFPLEILHTNGKTAT